MEKNFRSQYKNFFEWGVEKKLNSTYSIQKKTALNSRRNYKALTDIKNFFIKKKK